MLKVTADTNTLVSATIAKGNEFELLKLAYEGKIELILSPSILKELREVISRPKFGFSEQQISPGGVGDLIGVLLWVGQLFNESLRCHA